MGFLAVPLIIFKNSLPATLNDASSPNEKEQEFSAELHFHFVFHLSRLLFKDFFKRCIYFFLER